MSKETLAEFFNIVLWKDNQTCLSDARNSRLSELSKHVDLYFHLLVDHVFKDDLQVEYVPSKEIVLCLLAKNLQVQKSKSLLALLVMSWYETITSSGSVAQES